MPRQAKKTITKFVKEPSTTDQTEDSQRLHLVKYILPLTAVGIVVVAVLLRRQADYVLADIHSSVNRTRYNVECSDDYKADRQKFPQCAPRHCGRVVMDNVVNVEDARHLVRIAKTGLHYGGSNGGASILDLHSGALSKGDSFVDVYTLVDNRDKSLFSKEDFQIYSRVRDRIHTAIANEFNIPKSSLHLTSPTFFSRMTTKDPSTIHDEYWHVHVDKKTYGSFDYTSLLYLSDYDYDFLGGQFIFVDTDKNVTVHPKLGRLSFFTSGSENPHKVARLTRGTRYAITVSFTCDPAKAISDPTGKAHKCYIKRGDSKEERDGITLADTVVHVSCKELCHTATRE